MVPMQKKRRRREKHFLNENGMVACNPRDREAAHRAQVEGIATVNAHEVTCGTCYTILKKTMKRT